MLCACLHYESVFSEWAAIELDSQRKLWGSPHYWMTVFLLIRCCSSLHEGIVNNCVDAANISALCPQEVDRSSLRSYCDEWEWWSSRNLSGTFHRPSRTQRHHGHPHRFVDQIYCRQWCLSFHSQRVAPARSCYFGWGARVCSHRSGYFVDKVNCVWCKAANLTDACTSHHAVALVNPDWSSMSSVDFRL